MQLLAMSTHVSLWSQQNSFTAKDKTELCHVIKKNSPEANMCALLTTDIEAVVGGVVMVMG